MISLRVPAVLKPITATPDKVTTAREAPSLASKNAEMIRVFTIAIPSLSVCLESRRKIFKPMYSQYSIAPVDGKYVKRKDKSGRRRFMNGEN